MHGCGKRLTPSGQSVTTPEAFALMVRARSETRQTVILATRDWVKCVVWGEVGHGIVQNHLQAR